MNQEETISVLNKTIRAPAPAEIFFISYADREALPPLEKVKKAIRISVSISLQACGTEDDNRLS